MTPRTTPQANSEAGPRRAGAAAFCLLALFLAAFTGAASAAANLEEKLKYERALEQKTEEVLANLLGPGTSRVMIRAAVDFSSKESVEEVRVLEAPAETAEKPAEPLFKWQDINKQASSVSELLPGFPAEIKESAPAPQVAAQAAPRPAGGKTLRETVFPQSMIRRLTVSLVLSDRLSAGQAQKARQVVSDLLALDPSRGDEILVTRARFMPAWYTYEMLLAAVKYGIPGLALILGMALVSLGFFKLASALRSRQAPGATSQAAGTAPPALGGGNNLDTAAPDRSAGKTAEREALLGEPPGGVIFNVHPDKLEILVRMLSKDEPADIAIIAVHLPAALRGRFISMLPPETAAEVLASVVKVRFVEPGLIEKIKEELETRLNGAVGGLERAVEIIEEAGSRSQEAFLDIMQRTHPEIAARLRSRILLLEDLENLDGAAFDILAANVGAELWAAAAWRMSEAARGRLKARLTKGARKIFERTMASGAPPGAKVDAAVEQVLAAVRKLVAEGRVKKPEPARPAIGFDRQAASET